MGENVDVFESTHCTIDQIVDARGGADVSGNGVGRTTFGAYCISDTIDVRRRARVYDDERAFAGEPVRDGFTNPLSGARYDGYFAIQAAAVRFIHRPVSEYRKGDSRYPS